MAAGHRASPSRVVGQRYGTPMHTRPCGPPHLKFQGRIIVMCVSKITRSEVEGVANGTPPRCAVFVCASNALNLNHFSYFTCGKSAVCKTKRTLLRICAIQIIYGLAAIPHLSGNYVRAIFAIMRRFVRKYFEIAVPAGP